MPAYSWNEALARAARHVQNEEGACGTKGTAYSEFIHDVLGRYYAYEYENLYFQKVSGPELVNMDALMNSGWSALEYMLAQDHISTDIFTQSPKQIGIGCGCDSEEFPGEHNWACYIVIADSVVPRSTNVFIPYFQSTRNWDKCSDNCLYLDDFTAMRWDSLYNSECPSGLVLDD